MRKTSRFISMLLPVIMIITSMAAVLPVSAGGGALYDDKIEILVACPVAGEEITEDKYTPVLYNTRDVVIESFLWEDMDDFHMVEAGEKLGFLPGDMKEKIDPYLQPLYDALQDMIPAAKLTEFMEKGTIQIAPLAFMRGRTLSDAVVILDEAQNTTVLQLKMFLTRLGLGGKMIVTGDMTQIDLPATQKSGLRDALERFKGIKGIKVIEFNEKDIVRHPLVKHIVAAYKENK